MKKTAGRPKGRRDRKPRKRKTPAKKIVESPVVTTPKPIENSEFVTKLDQLDPTKLDQAAAGGIPAEILIDPKDVSEWVAWSFLTWAQFNKLSDLKLTEAEALSVAKPLTKILNRHGVGEVIPPDWLDGLTAAGRLSSIMIKRFEIIKIEREKRKSEQGSSEDHSGSIQEETTAVPEKKN